MNTLKKNKSIKLKKKTTPKTTKTTQRVASSSNGAKKLEDYEQTRPKQLELFEFTKPQQKVYSNTIELYDAIPKYFWGKQKRDKIGRLELGILRRVFAHRGNDYKVTIQPAKINGKSDTYKEFYPGKREELVEDALRKMACEGNGLFLDNHAGVTFTLYELKKELGRMGHTYNLAQIKEAIMICGKVNLEIKTIDEKAILSSNLFMAVGLATQEDWKGHGKKTNAHIIFNPLVTKSIQEKTFRLLNYDKSMSYKYVLSRWFHKRMSHNYIQASPENLYSIMLSTIVRDSGVKRYAAFRNNVRDVKKALDEMKEKMVLDSYEVKSILEKRKFVDAKFILIPHDSFVSEVKYSNKLYKEMREEEEREEAKKAIQDIRKKLERI